MPKLHTVQDVILVVIIAVIIAVAIVLLNILLALLLLLIRIALIFVKLALVTGLGPAALGDELLPCLRRRK
jgi:hypothetical protein